MLSLKNLSKTFASGKCAALKEVNLNGPEGSIVALLGPSGSGKTTLLRLIMGFMAADEGTILWKNEALTAGQRIIVKPAMRRFSIVFQEYVLLPHLDVFDNVALGLDGLTRPERQRQVHELLNLFQLDHRARAGVDELSGGEQQRVALARALSVSPRLLLMDEPFSNIDQRLRGEISAKVRGALKERGVTTVLVTHDHREAFYFSDYIYILREGRLVAHGSSRDIYHTPATAWIAAFVGEINRLTPQMLRNDLGCGDAPDLGDNSLYLVRPEELLLQERQDGEGNGRVVDCDFVGPYEEVTVELRSGGTVKVWDFQRRGMAASRSVDVILAHRSFLREVKQ